MVTSPIVAPAPDVLNVRADAYDKLAGYEAFRRIKDDFAEPARPSLHDVESVAAVLADAVGLVESQNSFTFADTEPLAGVVEREDSRLNASYSDSWADRHGLDGAGQIRHDSNEGRTHRVSISPGIIRRRTFDAARLEATEQRRIAARAHKLAGGWMGIPFALPEEEKTVGGEIRLWSEKSRVRMLVAVASLDYSEWLQESGTLAMVTLTLPGNWEVLAPDGATFKRMLEKFRRRWVRATGAPWVCLWKLEFQRRGAPHWHALMRVPVFVKGRIFTEWLSETWADVAGASKTVDGMDKWGDDTSEYLRHLQAGTAVDFSGKDFSDPRRISMYFLGHSTKSADGKEYQHVVPALWQEKGKGPGRFWGYSGLSKAVVELDVSERQKVLLDRQLRKVKRARDWKMNVLREQGNALRLGLPVPAVPAVQVTTRGRRPVKGEIALRRGSVVPAELNEKRQKRQQEKLVPLWVAGNGRAAHRRANDRARAAHALGYVDKAPVVGIGPVLRVSTLVLVPPAYQTIGKDGRVGEGPDNLVLPAFVPQKRSRYGAFSRGQGGFVLVNDALRLGLDLARFLRGS